MLLCVSDLSDIMSSHAFGVQFINAVPGFCYVSLLIRFAFTMPKSVVITISNVLISGSTGASMSRKVT